MVSPAIEALGRYFSSEQLLLAGTDKFKELNKSYLSCLESDLTPSAIFLPKTVDDVAKFVETIGPFSMEGTTVFASAYLPRESRASELLRLRLPQLTI